MHLLWGISHPSIPMKRKKQEKPLTEQDLWAAYDAHQEDLAAVADRYFEAKQAGNRTRANSLIAYFNTLQRQFYQRLEEHVDSLPVDLQAVISYLRQRREAPKV